MTTRSVASPRGRTALALVLIGVGVVLSLDSAGGLGRWWPLLLIGIGIVKVRQPREDGQRSAGVAFLMLGGLLQLTSLVSLGSPWPVLMMAFGGFLIWQGIEAPECQRVTVSESPYLSDMTLLGYVKRSHHASDFRGGSVTVVMGGVELDLRKAALKDGTAYLDVVAFWGGVEIKVPAGWTVDGRVVPVMGAFENKMDPLSPDGAPKLVVRGHAIMGAVVIGP
jgi:Cell wall-active antibiotics response 4TMS YvqF